jgi:Na+/proline symporter
MLIQHSFGMILTTFVLKRYNYELQTSEMFSTAGRTVKSGLVASAVVSSWTWAATLLQSSAVAYRYGVSGPFWYASGATVQIILFATIAIELKRRAPNAHTFLEVIRARYGAVTHIVFMVFGIFTNILVTSMLLTGGSAVVTSVCQCTVMIGGRLTCEAYWDAHCGCMFPPPCWCCIVHHVRWHQGYILDRLR